MAIPLTETAKELLRKIVAAYGSQPFEEAKLEYLRPVIRCRAEHNLDLMELVRTENLFVMQKLWGERLYGVPEGKLPFLLQLFFPVIPLAETSSDIQITMEEGRGLPADLLIGLLFAAKEGLPLTVKGVLHKKTVSGFAARLQLQNKHLDRLGLNWRNQEEYPASVAVILDLLIFLGLIKRQEGAFRIETEVLKSWLLLPEEKMHRLLFKAVMDRYGRPETVAQHFRWIIMRPEFELGHWVSLGSLLDWMENSGLSNPSFRQQLEISSLAWLECLTGCGWCQLGSDSAGDVNFRWVNPKPDILEKDADYEISDGEGVSAPAIPEALLVIQPDFEILVPSEAPYSVRWTLGCIAELQRIDIMWSYKLTREQFEFGYESGIFVDEAIRWLDDHSLGGLPVEVESALRQWGMGLGRTQLSESLLLECKHEEDADLIEAHPKLQGLLNRVGPLYFKINKDKEGIVRKELAEAALAPPKEVLGRNPEFTQPVTIIQRAQENLPKVYVRPESEQQAGLIQTGKSHGSIQRMPVETLDCLLIAVNKVPSSWIRDWRAYHGSTAQAMMEQALEMGVKVRISLDGKSCEFIPSRIMGHPWRVAGYLTHIDESINQEIVLPAGGWREMQLIIPSDRENSLFI
ncbi:helicase-associated domain-containing protein [Paenibacillus sp. sgz500958]|uniref:helicase-associated domain-containing protein n=1 Tax=Paenibacillus sp. sgz500958 TaxID=3242475 RepID=UPI0036D4162D